MDNSYQKTSAKSRKFPRHGEILAYYILVYDANIAKKILIPASRFDIVKGTIKLP